VWPSRLIIYCTAPCPPHPLWYLDITCTLSSWEAHGGHGARTCNWASNVATCSLGALLTTAGKNCVMHSPLKGRRECSAPEVALLRPSLRAGEANGVKPNESVDQDEPLLLEQTVAHADSSRADCSPVDGMKDHVRTRPSGAEAAGAERRPSLRAAAAKILAFPCGFERFGGRLEAWRALKHTAQPQHARSTQSTRTRPGTQCHSSGHI
jgi:hypothetical protein